MLYRSANFDEEVFDNPFVFDILRDPNLHVGFGGHGARNCVGANLARLGLKLIFNAIADVVPDIKVLGPPDLGVAACCRGTHSRVRSIVALA